MDRAGIGDLQQTLALLGVEIAGQANVAADMGEGLRLGAFSTMFSCTSIPSSGHSCAARTSPR